MCRNITALRGLEPEATPEEVESTAELLASLPPRRRPPATLPPLRRLGARAG